MKEQAYPEIGIDDLVVISTTGSNMSDTVTAGAVEDMISISAIDTIDLGAFGSGYGINYPNTLSATNANVTVSGGGILGGAGYANSIFSVNDSLNVRPSATIDLHGDDADIRINGESLMETLNMMKQRLAWLDVRSDLESEWHELRELGDRYRALVANIEDKTRMWETLKKMPPPIIP
jgi:hypothetical protein